MNGLHFSASALWGYGIAGTGMILLPVTVLLIWLKKTHVKLMPVIVGAIVFPVFALGLKLIPAYFLLYADNGISRAAAASPVITYLIAGILAGLFEETGRFAGFKFLQKKHHTSPQTCISYGIGHGGFEAAYIGVSMFSFIVMGILVNNGMTAELTKNLPEEQIPAAMEQIGQYANFTVGTALLGICERISAMLLHTALSILVFRAVTDKRSLWLYPAAMVLHAAVDFACVLSKTNILLVEIVFGALCAVTFFLTIRFVYRKLPKDEEVPA